MNNTIRIYDSGGATIDRYTAIIGASYYVMSENAHWPSGVNMYGGPAWKLDPRELGEPIDFDDLPIGTQYAINERMKHE